MLRREIQRLRSFLIHRQIKSRAGIQPVLQGLEPRTLLSLDLAGPTNLEQYMLQLINRARSDPAAEGQRLLEVARSNAAVAAMAIPADLDAFLREIWQYVSMPPLAFDAGLIEAARDHSLTMLNTNDQRHSPNGYLTNSQVARADNGGPYFPVGTGAWATGENIYAYTGNVASSNWVDHIDYLHAGLMIDWGNPSFGHLKNILAPGPGSADGTRGPFRSIGIGILTDATPTVPPPKYPDIPANRGLNVGPAIVTQEFGWRKGPAILTGAVFSDMDGDSFYTPGEGLGGVTIEAVNLGGQGIHSVRTWASGGYSLELPTGVYSVTVHGGNFPGSRSTVIHIGTDNVGWDVVHDPGARADFPVPADYDGDGRVELAVFDASSARWVIQGQSQGMAAQFSVETRTGVPVPADYDGDGKVDQAVFFPDSAIWRIALSTGGNREIQFGMANHDLPVPADYDGDGKADLAVFRPSSSTWFLLQSSDGPRARQFGMANHDLPVPADYDGDGKADLAVFRPSTAQWFRVQSSTGPMVTTLGAAGAGQMPTLNVNSSTDGIAQISSIPRVVTAAPSQASQLLVAAGGVSASAGLASVAPTIPGPGRDSAWASPYRLRRPRWTFDQGYRPVATIDSALVL